MNKKQVVITGLGAVTSNGTDVKHFFDNSIAGKPGLSSAPHTLFDTSPLSTDYWGVVPDEALCAAGQSRNESMDTGYPYRDSRVDRIRELAFTAAAEALSDAGLTTDAVRNEGNRAALSLGALSYDDYHLFSALLPDAEMDYALTHLSELAPLLKAYCGIEGVCYNFSSACSSGTVTIAAATELIRSGVCDLVLACGADPLSQIIAYGFHSLQILSSGLCHPLDENRDGINIGEGCGFLVLESADHAHKRGAKIYCEACGYSMGNEAYHIISPDVSADGFYSSMTRALTDAGLSPEAIDYVNLHGTGTLVNDETELLALDRLYNGRRKKPSVSSLKTLTGHCMGASGALEAVLTAKCLECQTWLPAHNISQPMALTNRLPLASAETKKPLEYAMSNSFAFAGNTATIILKRWNDSEYTKHTAIPTPQTGNEKKCLITGIGFLAAEPEHTAQAPTPGISARKLRTASHMSRLALSASLSCIGDAGADYHSWNPEQVGTLFSSAFSPIDDRIALLKTLENENLSGFLPSAFANISPNAPLGHMCINLHCKGSSTSLRGASPFPLAVRLLLGGQCPILLSNVTEEYHASLADAIAHRKTSEVSLPYLENSISLLMEYGTADKGYCAVENVYSCDIGCDPYIDRPDTGYLRQTLSRLIRLSAESLRQHDCPADAVFITGEQGEIERVERELFSEILPEAGILSLSENNLIPVATSFYANIATAAKNLQQGMFSSAGKTFPLRHCLVTGYDVCGNYHIAHLSSITRRNV